MRKGHPEFTQQTASQPMTDRKSPAPLPPDHPDFLLEDSPLYNINRTSAIYIREMAKILNSVGMDQPRWRILTLLSETNPATVSSISERSFIKLSTITRILIRMEAEGLVRRQTRTEDNRVTEVYATDEGRAKLAGLRKVAGRIYRHAFAGLPDSEIVQLVRTLKKIHDNFQRSPYAD